MGVKRLNKAAVFATKKLKLMEGASSTFYSILQSAHSGTRWLTLILLVAAVANALVKSGSKASFTGTDRGINLGALIFTHLQIAIGLILYGVSPKVNIFNADMGAIMGDAFQRFYAVEHPLTMIVAAVLITIGNSKSKKATEDGKRFKATYMYMGIGLVLILSRIPWPFQDYGAGWF